ncbi:MAG: DNA topoisomerase (ATP-hydrolyzing) [Lachnospiraceae bacterium]|jgi:DNA topoisomerase (ATP-hydrolyzing)|nr:DNA topoisomerase 4 subunit A [Lachnoclostridium sp.]MDD7520554.1 DNA topoisomerase 4 subunit A [Lachnoclostridium sp.]MDY2598796.1 DNA topoisomerase (ATP-hydrolyzing) [Lachnospiraceae bacterium]
MARKKKDDMPIVENIVSMDFAEEMRTSYRDYAMSVIISRALPDVRDGLKPVQRRILYAMKELGLAPDKPHRKSARIVGDTMGKYHPHGDSSIYDALVHMTEDYSLSMPLIDGHGNFGSIDGDSAAAMRYTEARLSGAAMTMLNHLEKGLVDFMPNFDESEKEPCVLPAMLPNLIINGTTGIAVGMATNIPPHNPVEVINGVIACIDRPGISLEKLMEYIPGPDFPTGGTIINKEEIPSIYETGEGKLRIRAKTVIEPGENGRTNIIVTEIPYTVAGNKTKLVESLAQLMKDKVFDEIYDVRDESGEDIRIIIEVKKDRDANNLLNGLYKKTPMEETYGVNMLAVKDKQPIQFSLKGIIEEFISFQKELYTKEYNHLLNKANARLEIVNGLIRATDVIDLIIEVLRGSKSLAQAKGCLIHGDITDIKFKSEASKKEAMTFDFTESQADAILAMPLSKLIGLEIMKLHEEGDKLTSDITDYMRILGDEKELLKVIKKRLREFAKQFEGNRKTVLASVENVVYTKKVVIEDVYVLIDKFGYTKCMDQASFNRLTEDTVKEFPYVIPIKSDDKLCVFTANGNLHQIKVSAIPRCKARDKGVLVHNLCKLNDEDVVNYMAFEDLFDSIVLFITAKGFIKLVSGAQFETNRATIASTKLDDDDMLVCVKQLSASEYSSNDNKVVMVTEKEQSLGFMLSEVSEFKKTSRGVKGITLDKGDKVAFGACVSLKDETIKFKGRTVQLKKIRTRKRGQKAQKASGIYQ